MKLPYEIPAGLLGQAALGPDWADFIRRLPRLTDEMTDEWRLTYDGAPSYGYTGLVLPVLTDDGRRELADLGTQWQLFSTTVHDHLQTGPAES